MLPGLLQRRGDELDHTAIFLAFSVTAEQKDEWVAAALE